MASAVLASRNEPYWGESNVYMRKFTNNTSNNPNLSKFNPSPNPNHNSESYRPSYDFQGKFHAWRRDEPPPPPPSEVAPPAATDGMYRRTVVNLDDNLASSYGEYVSFNLAEYSRRELKGIKRRLISELEQVRSIRARIEAREVESRSGYRGPAIRPPQIQIQLNHAVSSSILTENPTPKAATRKNQKVSGNKSAPNLAPGRNRRAAALDSPEMRSCKQILTKLMSHKHGWVFKNPVDVVGLGLHDYLQIIKHPMDLGTVKSKLDGNGYRSPVHFASDVRLTFNNAMTYNPKGQEVYIMADTMLQRFEELFRPVYKKLENANRSDSASAQPTLSNPPLIQELPAPESAKSSVVAPISARKMPKPRAKDRNKREMTFEEKTNLGMNLQNLPQEKMVHILLIIKKRNRNLAQEGDEIELDMEALDTETLWELDRFVGSHMKKAMSMVMKQEEPPQCLIDDIKSGPQINKSPVSEAMTEAVMMQKNKKGGGGDVEEDVDIGEEIPMSYFPPVEIEKDQDAANGSSRSSGSSSSSDSSSSSGSSSGSDSEGDSVRSPNVESKATDSVRSPNVESKAAPVTEN